MMRLLAISLLVISGMISIASSASAEDGGQYYMGGGGNVVSEPIPSTLQR